jgi:hypothetical protein
MGKPYTVQRGDNLTAIARRFGLSNWQDLYNSPDNAAFRAKRSNPNLIFPGDIIVIPDNLTPQVQSGANRQSSGNSMLYDIVVGSVSWIADIPSPVDFSPQALYLEPDWVPKTYMGLSATANPTPSDIIPDFKVFQATKQFRALLYCHFTADIDLATNVIKSFTVVDAVHDGGWTPPFDRSKFPLTRLKPDKNMSDPNFYQGEASPLSLINTQARHKNSVLTGIGVGEVVLVNGLIKFRAGKHTDDIGVKDVGCPFHVPWVWSEFLLTYKDSKFTLTGNGSIFPSHAWYFKGKCVNTQEQVTDKVFPKSGLLTINKFALNLYPVLSAGAIAAGPQTLLSDESAETGPVNTQSKTAPGAKTPMTYTWLGPH